MINKLKAFGKLIGLNEIIECEDFENGPAINCYIYPQKIITIYKGLSEKDKIVVLAHEMGHFLNRSRHESLVDLSAEAIKALRSLPPKHQVLIKYYHPGLNKIVTTRAHEAILQEERLAWESAKMILNHLGIPLTSEFNKTKKMALGTYEKGYLESLTWKDIVKAAGVPDEED